MQSANPQSGLYVTNGISSKQKRKERGKKKTQYAPVTTLKLPYNSLPPCNATTATTPLALLISLTGHAPLKLLPEDARLDGVGAAVCVPAAGAFAGARVVELADETWLVGEPVAEPDAGGEEVVGELEALGGEEALGAAAEAAEGARTAAAAAGTEDFAGAEVWDWDWDGPEGVGEDVGFCTSASALPLPLSLGAAALASSSPASLICEHVLVGLAALCLFEVPGRAWEPRRLSEKKRKEDKTREKQVV